MMKRWAILLCLLAAAALGGCPADWQDPFRSSGQDEPDPSLVPVAADGPEAAGDRKYFLVVRVKMVTISLPVGAISGSEQLWGYLDEERVDAIRSASLGRNGLRVGLAREADWPDVASVLEQMTGRQLKTTTLISRPGEPLTVALRTRQPAQTVFVFYDDRTLAGRDYPPGDNILAMSCTLNEDDPTQIILTGLPQIRTTRQRSRFVSGPGGAMVVSRPDFYSFDALTFQVKAPAKSVLIIGPSARSYRPSSVGNHFLIHEKSGLKFETVIVLIPEVFAAPLPSQPTPSGGLGPPGGVRTRP